MDYSVLMTVYWKEKAEYLKAAMESMFKQTVPPTDFVLVCDGPLSDELDKVINSMERSHSKILKVIRLAENRGLGNALNAGLEQCRYELVARMDSDDISLPYRCEHQLMAFKRNAELALCSGNIAEFEINPDDIKGIRIVPATYEEILRFAKRRNPMNHMAVMYKKTAIKEVGGYVEIKRAEDYYLWARLLQRGYYACNIDEILVKVRVGDGMYERRGGIDYMRSMLILQKRLLEMHFVSVPQFTVNCMFRLTASLMPTTVRKRLYQVWVRKCV